MCFVSSLETKSAHWGKAMSKIGQYQNTTPIGIYFRTYALSCWFIFTPYIDIYGLPAGLLINNKSNVPLPYCYISINWCGVYYMISHQYMSTFVFVAKANKNHILQTPPNAFFKRNFLNLYCNFPKIYFCECNLTIKIGSDNGLPPNSQQAMTWFTFNSLRSGYVHITIHQWVKYI